MRNWWKGRERVHPSLQRGVGTWAGRAGRGLSGTAVVIATLLMAQPVYGQSSPVLPGDVLVQGEALWGYESSWQSRVHNGTEWTDQSVVTEHLRREGDRWIRTQVTDLGPWGTETVIEMDAATLRPIRLTRTLLEKTPESVLAQLAQAGFVREFEMNFEGTGYTLSSTPFEGEAATTEHDVGTPYYDGSVLGLVVAALPLEEGHQARLPILFVDGRNGDVTMYWVDSTVGRQESVAGRPAVRVDVAWADLETGEVTSEPGPDSPGGAYWIDVSGAGAGPVVPRYKNDSFDIVVTR